MHAQPSNAARCLIFGQTLRRTFICVNSEGSGQTARMRRLAWAFAVRLCDKYHNVMSWLNYWFPSTVFSGYIHRPWGDCDEWSENVMGLNWITEDETFVSLTNVLNVKIAVKKNFNQLTHWRSKTNTTISGAARQNQQNGKCTQRRLRSTWASPQSDQSSLFAWRKLWSLATHWVHSEDSYQTGRMPRLIWVFAGHKVILLVLSWGDLICGKQVFNTGVIPFLPPAPINFTI